jgi:hypothetical protein
METAIDLIVETGDGELSFSQTDSARLSLGILEI